MDRHDGAGAWNAGTARSSTLTLVSCPDTGACVAEGDYDDGEATEEMLDSLSGGVWTATQAPLPANAGTHPEPDPTGLVCVSVGSCTAVGVYDGQTGANDYALVQTLWRGTWTASEAPLPADAAAVPDNNLAGLTCPAAGSAWPSAPTAISAGTNLASSRPSRARPGPPSWHPFRPMPPTRPAAFPFAVTCPTTDFCTSTWIYQDAANDDAVRLRHHRRPGVTDPSECDGGGTHKFDHHTGPI